MKGYGKKGSSSVNKTCKKIGGSKALKVMKNTSGDKAGKSSAKGAKKSKKMGY
jgi:hypothetical protein